MEECISADLNKTVVLDEQQDLQTSLQPCLVIVSGKDSYYHYELKQGVSTVGRSAQADITIADDQISRIHCTIEFIADTITIEDNGSTNGIFVDSHRVKHAKLLPGTSLQLGQSIMKIDYKSKVEIQAEENLLQKASIDSLTGVYNRHHFFNLASMELSYTLRHYLASGIIMFGIDNFKHINDKFGHQLGDFILSQFANIVHRNLRAEDILARYGGDEFIILPHGKVSKDFLYSQCERLRKDIENFQFRCGDEFIQITISLGFHLKKDGIGDVEKILYELIQKADQALHLAKEKGKNCTVCLI